MPHREKNPYLRIVDANFNRLKEAFRVIEEFIRFGSNDKAGSKTIKELRHSVTKILLSYRIPYVQLLANRDSINDVSKTSAFSDVGKPNSKDIIIANFKRAQEALRVLEELSKIVDPKAAPKFQHLRFEAYELERKIICEL